MIIKQYKKPEDYIEELSKEVRALFNKEGFENNVFDRWYATMAHANQSNETIIAALCARLMQGKRYIYPYRFGYTYSPEGFKAPIIDSEVDGLLYFDERDFEGHSTKTYFERFTKALQNAFAKFE